MFISSGGGGGGGGDYIIFASWILGRNRSGFCGIFPRGLSRC